MKNRFSSRMIFVFSLVLVAVLGFSGRAMAQDVGGVDEQLSEAVRTAIQELLTGGKIDDAVAKLETECSKNPELPPAPLLLAAIFSQQNQARAARQLVERTVVKYPTDPEAYISLGRMNLQQGNITEAELLYRQAGGILQKFTGNEKRKQNMSRDIYMGTAEVSFARENYKQAITLLTNLLKADPKLQPAWNLLGLAYFQDGNVAEALTAFAQLKKLEPKALQPEARVAMMYQQKDDKANAKEYMEKAIKVASSDIAVRLVAAQWLMQLNQVPAAVVQADAALKLDGASLDAQLLRGQIALFQDDYVTAETNFKKAFDISSSNFNAVNGLALAMCAQGNDEKLKKAEEYALMNLRSFEKNPAASATAAWVLYHKGDYQQAGQLLQQSTQLANGQLNPDTAFFFAATLAKLGSDEQKKRAKEILTELLKNDSLFMMRKKAEELNKQL